MGPRDDRLVILDIGATLVTGPARGPWSRIAERLDLDAGTRAALRRALMTERFDAPEEVVAFLRSIGSAGDDVAQAVEDVWVAQMTEAEPLPGAFEALAALRDTGLRIALISNIWAPYLASVRVSYGAFFDDEVSPELQYFSFREGVAKPSQMPFRTILERAGVTADAALMIGDSYAEDIEPAAALGLQTLWVLHRPQREADALVRVLNGDAPRATRTIRSIGALDVEGAFAT